MHHQNRLPLPPRERPNRSTSQFRAVLSDRPYPLHGMDGSELNKALSALGKPAYKFLSPKIQREIDAAVEGTSEHIVCFHINAAANLGIDSAGRTIISALRAATTHAACVGAEAEFIKAHEKRTSEHNHLSQEEIKAIFDERR